MAYDLEHPGPVEILTVAGGAIALGLVFMSTKNAAGSAGADPTGATALVSADGAPFWAQSPFGAAGPPGASANNAFVQADIDGRAFQSR
jgi:hypothetical protein